MWLAIHETLIAIALVLLLIVMWSASVLVQQRVLTARTPPVQAIEAEPQRS